MTDTRTRPPDESDVVRLEGAVLEHLASGEGPAVVLLPGGGLSVGYLAGLARALAGGGYRAVRVNPRGAGRSTGAGEGVSKAH